MLETNIFLMILNANAKINIVSQNASAKDKHLYSNKYKCWKQIFLL